MDGWSTSTPSSVATIFYYNNSFSKKGLLSPALTKPEASTLAGVNSRSAQHLGAKPHNVGIKCHSDVSKDNTSFRCGTMSQGALCSSHRFPFVRISSEQCQRGRSQVCRCAHITQWLPSVISERPRGFLLHCFVSSYCFCIMTRFHLLCA